MKNKELSKFITMAGISMFPIIQSLEKSMGLTDNYIDNLDVSDEIKGKLHEMIEHTVSILQDTLSLMLLTVDTDNTTNSTFSNELVYPRISEELFELEKIKDYFIEHNKTCDEDI